MPTLKNDALNSTDVSGPELFINREISQLKFNQRVLEQAKDSNTPLLERLKFLCISCSNLDEFFEIRVFGIKQHIEFSTGHTSADNKPAKQVLKEVHEATTTLVNEQYRVFNDVVLPELAKQNVHFIPREK